MNKILLLTKINRDDINTTGREQFNNEAPKLLEDVFAKFAALIIKKVSMASTAKKKVETDNAEAYDHEGDTPRPNGIKKLGSEVVNPGSIIIKGKNVMQNLMPTNAVAISAS
jgi:hypothetical protein